MSRKILPENPPEDNYQEAQWQIDENIFMPQDDSYALAREAEFGGHLFDIPFIYTDANASDFGKGHTPEPYFFFSTLLISLLKRLSKRGNLPRF